MKKSIIIGLFASIALLSCSKDDSDLVKLNPDFELTVTGESPNAELSITNNSTGATGYQWSLSEGASISTSSDKTPGAITVDKAGDLEVTLIVSNGSVEKEITKTVTVTGNNAVVTYTDLEFAHDGSSDVYGRLFSFETGKMYKDSEISAENGSLIHLAYEGWGNSLFFFESPTVTERYDVPGATLTLVKNFVIDSIFSVDDFDALEDDSKLKDLTIIDDNNAFGNNYFPGIILFEISTGQKGVIKAKYVNSDRIMVDIKIQKY
ncbi:MAG: hypothetical protein ABFR62_12440 [Bacteroidota bacterium]